MLESLFKKRLQHRCFSMKVAKFLGKSILMNICERLLLTGITAWMRLHIIFRGNYRISEFFLGLDNALHFKYSWRICQEKVKMQRRGRVFFNGLQTDYVAVIENKMWLIRWNVFQYLEAAAQRCSVKKVFLEILQNSQENTCARVSCLIKLQASGLKACNFIKKETLAEVFVNFVKFLIAPYRNLRWLLQNTLCNFCY